MIPMEIRVKNNKLFVLDKGFPGIKIFNLEGELIREIKCLEVSVISFDVDHQDCLYIGLNTSNNRIVQVHSFGNKKVVKLLADPITFTDRKVSEKYLFQLEVDNNKNIYLLFPVCRKIEKFDFSGESIWEVDIDNPILSEFPKNEYIRKNPKSKSGKGMYYSSRIFDFEVMADESIIIGHAKGGCILDKNGKLLKIINIKAPFLSSLFTVKIKNNKLYTHSNLSHEFVSWRWFK